MVRSPRRRSVLVASSLLTDPCHRGVLRFAREHGWHVVLDMRYSGAFPRGWRGDGVVALPGYDDGLIRHIVESGAPCVAIGLDEETVPFPTVSVDRVQLGRLAAEHLLERAYRHFAFAPFLHDQTHSTLHGAFKARLLENGFRCATLPAFHRRIGGFWHDDWMQHQRQLELALSELPKPVGIFAANDAAAAEIATICGRLGVEVPREVAILGLGNDEVVCDSAVVPLSSVQMDVEKLAYAAAAHLHAMLSGSTEISSPPLIRAGTVVTRLSTDACAVANVQVAQALSYIGEHYHEPRLGVGQICEALGISRRHLERVFKQQIGYSISDHILKRRMQEASRLLRTHARSPVREVSELVGFSDPRTFFRAFRRHFGQSPALHRMPETVDQEAYAAPATIRKAG